MQPKFEASVKYVRQAVNLLTGNRALQTHCLIPEITQF